mgnify:CR=1 FL=1
MIKICKSFFLFVFLFIKINASDAAPIADETDISSGGGAAGFAPPGVVVAENHSGGTSYFSSTEIDKFVLRQRMICSMQEKLMNKKGKASLERDAVGRERYEEKVKTGTACVYEECLLTPSLLEELKAKAFELKSYILDGSVLIQVGRSPWLLQEMMTALGLDVSWITLPFSHKVGFARTEWDLRDCSNSEWTVDELPEPQKTWVTSYINFLQTKLHITEGALSPFKGRIYIIDYISSGESLQDALELVNKAIGSDLGIRKIGFCEETPYSCWDTNPTNTFFSVSHSLGRNMTLKHALTVADAEKHSIAEYNPDSFFENAHGHTFYPAEWADPIALARVSESAPLTLTVAAKRQQIIEYASSYRSDKK